MVVGHQRVVQEAVQEVVQEVVPKVVQEELIRKWCLVDRMVAGHTVRNSFVGKVAGGGTFLDKMFEEWMIKTKCE